MKPFFIMSILIIWFNVLYADATIQTLQSKYKKRAKINIKVVKDKQFAPNDLFKLTVFNKDLNEDIKTYTQNIKETDLIELPEGKWDFELFYKFGYSTYKATYNIKSKKTYDIEIQLATWFDLEFSDVIAGQIFDKQLAAKDFSQTKVEDYELARLAFYGLPIKGSFAPIEKTFLTNWLITKPFGGQVWFCSRLPFPIESNDKDFFNFTVLQKLDPNKTLSYYYHPSNSKLQHTLYMRSLPQFEGFFDKHDKYYCNMAASLVFDTIAGPLYSGLDIDLTSEADLRIWYTLLNMGYQIPAISSDYLAPADNENSWLFMPLKSESSIEDKFKMLKNGSVTMSNGPSLYFCIDKVLPGQSIIADNNNHQMTVRANVDPSTGDEVEYFEIIRNGEVHKKIKPELVNHIFQVHFYHVFEQSYAWYVVKVKTKIGHVAVSNPIFFLPEGYQAPAPASALVKISVLDSDSNNINEARIMVYDGAKILYDELLKENVFDKQLPLTARVVIQKEGYVEDAFYLADNPKYYQLFQELFVKETGGPNKLADPLVYKKMRDELKILFIKRTLKVLNKE